MFCLFASRQDIRSICDRVQISTAQIQRIETILVAKKNIEFVLARGQGQVKLE